MNTISLSQFTDEISQIENKHDASIEGEVIEGGKISLFICKDEYRMRFRFDANNCPPELGNYEDVFLSELDLEVADFMGQYRRSK